MTTETDVEIENHGTDDIGIEDRKRNMDELDEAMPIGLRKIQREINYPDIDTRRRFAEAYVKGEMTEEDAETMCISLFTAGGIFPTATITYDDIRQVLVERYKNWAELDKFGRSTAHTIWADIDRDDPSDGIIEWALELVAEEAEEAGVPLIPREEPQPEAQPPAPATTDLKQ
jgi:hypothetical protein